MFAHRPSVCSPVSPLTFRSYNEPLPSRIEHFVECFAQNASIVRLEKNLQSKSVIADSAKAIRQMILGRMGAFKVLLRALSEWMSGWCS